MPLTVCLTFSTSIGEQIKRRDAHALDWTNASHPGSIAIGSDRIGARDLDRALTFAACDARACRLANTLLGFGLAKGDRVAVLAWNRVEWLEIYAAVAKAGLVAVPINFRLVAP